MKVKFYVADYGGCGWYRMIMPAIALSKRGIETKVSDFVRLVDFEQYDAFVFQRVESMKVLDILKKFKEGGKKVLGECDDALPLVPLTHPANKVLRKKATIFKEFIKSVDKVITTQKYLKEYLMQFNKKVEVFQNSIDFNVMPPENKREELRILWAGSSTHNEDCKIIIPVIKDLKQKEKFKFISMGAMFKYMEGVVDEYVKFTKFVSYYTKLAEVGADIGLAPLVKDEFNRYKSNIKVLEYLSLGILPVITDYGPYEGFPYAIKVKKNRYKDWDRAVRKAIEMVKSGEAKEFVEKGREYVKRNYSLDKNINKYIKILKEG